MRKTTKKTMQFKRLESNRKKEQENQLLFAFISAIIVMLRFWSETGNRKQAGGTELDRNHLFIQIIFNNL